jgi:hypothetical protein
MMEGDAQGEAIRYFQCLHIDALPAIKEAQMKTEVIDLGIDHQQETIELAHRQAT